MTREEAENMLMDGSSKRLSVQFQLRFGHRLPAAAQVCDCARVCTVNGMRLHMQCPLSSWASSVRGNVNTGPWPSPTGPAAASAAASVSSSWHWVTAKAPPPTENGRPGQR